MIEKFIKQAAFLDKKGKYIEADRFDRLAFQNDDTWIVHVLKERMLPDYGSPKYILRNELVSFRNDSQNDPEHPFTPMESAYSIDGSYIGNYEDAKFIVEDKGISPQKRSPEHCVCSIGLSEKDNKWYGWSHRATNGFGIGDEFIEADWLDESFSEYENPEAKAPDPDEAWSISQNKAQRRRKKIKNMDEARQAAINFAESVS